MGPPPAVAVAPAAPAAAAGPDSAFALQRTVAFSPPSPGDLPVRTAALPMAITGPRRSLDGSGGYRQQLSWTARPRAVSNPGGLDAPEASPIPASFDSFNMSMSRRSFDGSLQGRAALAAALRQQHSPNEQQLHGPAAPTAAGDLAGRVAGAGAGAAAAGPQAVGSFDSSWSADPVLLRQPSRRHSVDGGRPQP